MRAASYTERGPIHDVIAVGDIDDPTPGPGEVRVAVAVAGVNPTDWKSCEGDSPMVAPRLVPMQDGAGVIESVGPGVDSTRIGQRVWLFHAAQNRPWGTAAEFSVVPANQAVPLPDGIDFDQAAGIGIPAITAHGVLMSDGPIDGHTVLVAGGAGAVGHAAIELAVRAGARVISTVSSPEKAILATAAGAHAVVNYRDADASDQIRTFTPEGVDRIVEVSLGVNKELDLAVIAPHGVIVTYATEPQGDPIIPVWRLMMTNLTLRFALVYTYTPQQIDDALREITAALMAGELTPLPPVRFPLERTADALAAVKAGAVGKVLIDINNR